MKILFLTSRLPYPPYRGDKLKIWNLLRRVSSTHEVALLSFVQTREEELLAKHLEPYCEHIELVRLPVLSSLWQCVKAIPSQCPFQVAFFRSGEMEQKLDHIVREWKPDVIHTHLIRLAPYTAYQEGVRSVLDMTDAVSLYLQRFSAAERNPVKKFLLSTEHRRMIHFESIIREFSVALVCSSVDRDALIDNVPEANISLLYNGVDINEFAPQRADEFEPGRIIYTGNMSYFPNADGAEYLVEKILPRVRATVPSATLYIVGQNPPPRVRAMANEHIKVTGFVPDIRAEYARSALAVSPIRFGAGTLNKILEPLAMGVPVVSSPAGVAGLELEPGRDFLVAGNANEFAAHIINVLTDNELRARLSRSATDRVRQRFNWDTVAAALLGYYKAVVEQRSTKKPSPVK